MLRYIENSDYINNNMCKSASSANKFRALS